MQEEHSRILTSLGLMPTAERYMKVIPRGQLLYHGSQQQSDCRALQPRLSWFTPDVVEAALHSALNFGQ